MKVWIRPRRTSATQSAVRSHELWEIVPQLTDSKDPEPLMGWASSGDTTQELVGHLRFPTAEAAADFATKKGWEPHIKPRHKKTLQPRNYMQNFGGK